MNNKGNKKKNNISMLLHKMNIINTRELRRRNLKFPPKLKKFLKFQLPLLYF